MLAQPPPMQFPAFRVSIKTFAAGQKLVWSRPIPGRLCVMMAGEMRESMRTGEARYCPSDLVYKPPEEHPRLAFGAGGVRTVTVELDSGQLAGLGQAGLRLDRAFHGGSAPGAALGARIAAELRHRDEITPLAVEGLTLELLAEACRLVRPAPVPGGARWLHEVRERVREEFTRRLTLADCPHAVGVHPVHLAQSFRAHYGESFGQCIRRLRIDFASRVLAQTSKPIAEIALDAGFSDQSHFTKAFRHASGLTPAGFRRAFQRA